MWINIWTTWVDEIYVWEWKLVDDYSAMRWPCPEGFHVPQRTEWEWLKSIMDWLSLTTWDSRRINLHMPFAWHRSYSDWQLRSQWTGVEYRSVNVRSYDNISTIEMTSSNVSMAPYYNWQAVGNSVRAFKDKFISPNSNWIIIQWNIGGAWIFWNNVDWLISITDGSNGYTIMDKNLWATTVYNDWDTLSEANCWKYYQWGNNYWFSWTGSITTSSTRVNASGYWPGNYYSDSTFIIWSTSWTSVYNNNLRWWVTGVQQKQVWNVTEVYVGTTKIRPMTTYQQILDMATTEWDPRTNTIAELNSKKESYHDSLSGHLTTRAALNSAQYDTIDGISYVQYWAGTWRIWYRDWNWYRSLFNN